MASFLASKMNYPLQRNLIFFSIILLVVNQVLLTTLNEHFSPEDTETVAKQSRKFYLIKTRVCVDCEFIKTYLDDLNDPSLEPIRDAVEEYEARLASDFSIQEIN